ncbi:hypothetical protein [Cereibacter sphaeroides]|uniref:hypothetical protein n=1 Tax=Cereibacter sphaeroides TaxID=1063 RepID=UPI002E25DC6F
MPAAFPSILTGLKIGWAFAWRTLIAAELVFGVSSGPSSRLMPRRFPPLRQRPPAAGRSAI